MPPRLRFLPVYTITMSLLRTRVLQSLKRARTPKFWNLMIDPGPVENLGYQLDDQMGLREYRMKLMSGEPFEKGRHMNLLYGGSSNFGPAGLTKSRTNTRWVRLIENGQKNANGQALREVLIDIVKKFPNYDLQSKQGAEDAICDIESRLAPVALFMAHYPYSQFE